MIIENGKKERGMGNPESSLGVAIKKQLCRFPLAEFTDS